MDLEGGQPGREAGPVGKPEREPTARELSNPIEEHVVDEDGRDRDVIVVPAERLGLLVVVGRQGVGIGDDAGPEEGGELVPEEVSDRPRRGPLVRRPSQQAEPAALGVDVTREPDLGRTDVRPEVGVGVGVVDLEPDRPADRGAADAGRRLDGGRVLDVEPEPPGEVGGLVDLDRSARLLERPELAVEPLRGSDEPGLMGRH